MKPLWEKIHDAWIDDIRFDLYWIHYCREMQKKHIYDEMYQSFKKLALTLERHKKALCKSYRDVYGTLPKVIRIRKDIENGWKPQGEK